MMAVMEIHQQRIQPQPDIPTLTTHTQVWENLLAQVTNSWRAGSRIATIDPVDTADGTTQLVITMMENVEPVDETTEGPIIILGSTPGLPPDGVASTMVDMVTALAVDAATITDIYDLHSVRIRTLDGVIRLIIFAETIEAAEPPGGGA